MQLPTILSSINMFNAKNFLKILNFLLLWSVRREAKTFLFTFLTTESTRVLKIFKVHLFQRHLWVEKSGWKKFVKLMRWINLILNFILKIGKNIILRNKSQSKTAKKIFFWACLSKSCKVHIRILRRSQNFAKSPPYFWLRQK